MTYDRQRSQDGVNLIILTVVSGMQIVKANYYDDSDSESFFTSLRTEPTSIGMYFEVEYIQAVDADNKIGH